MAFDITPSSYADLTAFQPANFSFDSYEPSGPLPLAESFTPTTNSSPLTFAPQSNNSQLATNFSLGSTLPAITDISGLLSTPPTVLTNQQPNAIATSLSAVPISIDIQALRDTNLNTPLSNTPTLGNPAAPLIAVTPQQVDQFVNAHPDLTKPAPYTGPTVPQIESKLQQIEPSYNLNPPSPVTPKMIEEFRILNPNLIPPPQPYTGPTPDQIERLRSTDTVNNPQYLPRL